MTPDLDGYIAGDDGCGERICVALTPIVRAVARRQLGPDDAEIDDVVQVVLVAFLGYLRAAGVAPRNAEAFAVTMTRNRCHNLHLWRRRRPSVSLDESPVDPPHIAASPLEWVEQDERRRLLVQVLAGLDEKCRSLLNAVYGAETSMEELRARFGLKSVQAVYYRRDACLSKAQKSLNRLLLGCRVLRKEAAGLSVQCPEGEGPSHG